MMSSENLSCVIILPSLEIGEESLSHQCERCTAPASNLSSKFLKTVSSVNVSLKFTYCEHGLGSVSSQTRSNTILGLCSR
jgi:hypothetical protein